jgi:O-antigen ligase
MTNVGLQLTLILLFAFPIFPLRVSALAVYPFVILSALSFYNSSNSEHGKESLIILIAFSVIPIIYLSELLFTNNVPYVWWVVQRKLGLIFIPLGFFMLNHAGVQLNYKRFINVLVTVTSLMVVYCCGSIFYSGLNPEHVNSGGTAFAFRTAVSQLVHLHPTYFGLVIAYSALVLLNRIYTSVYKSWLFVFRLIVTLMLVTFLIVLAARMVFISFGVAALVLTIMRMNKWSHRLTMILAFIGLTAMSVQFVPTMHERFVEIFESESNSTNVREMIYSCTIEIVKDNWITGVSVEKLQFYLNVCYSQFALDGNTVVPNYNTHNEYLNLLCGKGVLGLASFLLLLTLLFKKALSQPDFLSFCLLFSLACLAENLLERQIGVFFFCIIGGLYGVYLPRKVEKIE